MLDRLRNFGRSWIAKVLIGLLIVSVAAFGIPSVFLDLGANTVARVGDEDISAREFERTYRSQLNRFAQQTGQVPTADQALQFGIPGSVLNQLANEAAVDGLAERMGLGASDERLAMLVRQDPSFSGSLGAFDRAQFARVLQQAGLTEAEYLEMQRNAAQREQITMAMFQPVAAPQTAVDIAYHYQNNQRTIDYVTLNPVTFAVSQEPSDEDLQAFFEENQAQFRTVETRTAEILPLTPEALAQNVTVSEEDVSAAYEQNSARYQTPETRTIQQVILPDAETAQAFETALENGTPFQEVLAETGLEDQVNDVGTLTQSQISDATLADVAFGLTEGGYAVADGAVGQRVISVSEVTPAGTQPLEAVRDEIAQNLRVEQAEDMMLDVYDEIENARAAFEPVAPVAEQYGLEVYEVELTQSGEALQSIDAIPESARQEVVSQVFAASEDANVIPAINLGGNSAIFFDLMAVEPARDQTLVEVRDQAVTAWQEQQTQQAMTAAAQDMVSALQSGADLFDLASEYGLVPQASQPFSREGGAASIAPSVAEAAFQGGSGHAGFARSQAGDVTVFQVSDITEASGEPADQLTQSLTQSFSNNLYASFMTAVQQDTGLRVNQETLNRVIGLGEQQ